MKTYFHPFNFINIGVLPLSSSRRLFILSTSPLLLPIKNAVPPFSSFDWGSTDPRLLHLFYSRFSDPSSLSISPSFSRSSDLFGFDSPYCKVVSNILSSPDLSTFEKQSLLEIFSIEYSFNFFHFHLSPLSSHAEFTFFRNSHSKILKSLDLLLNRYTINDFRFLLKLGPCSEAKIALLLILYDKDKLASIIFSFLVKLSSKVSSDPLVKNSLSLDLGNEVVRFFRFLPSISFPPTLQFVFSAYNSPNFYKSFGPIEKAQLGLSLVELVLEKFNFIICTTVTFNNSKESIVEFHPDFSRVVLKDGLFPLKLPLVHPPLPWLLSDSHSNFSSLGGYLTPIFREFSLSNSSDKDFSFVHQNLLNRFPSEPSFIQYDAINYLNKQAFVINKDVLNFVLLEWVKSDGLFGVFNKEHPLTGSKLSLFSKDFKDLLSHNNLYWIYRNTLNIAFLFQDTKFYLPTFLDFRGRIYPDTSYLSYQSTDLSRALFNFADSECISSTGLEYLHLYLASTYGLSKETFQSRLEWFKSNFDNFYNLYLDNKDKFCHDVLSRAKEKFQFLSVFLTLVKLKTHGLDTPVGTPILFDCTCSGLQHLSALCSNLTLARLVNVIEASDDPSKISDFYSIAADYVNATLSSLPSDNPLFKENLSKIIINRNVLKIPVLTIPYNISLQGITDKLYSTLVIDKIYENKIYYYKIHPDFIKGPAPKSLILTSSEFGLLSKYIYKSLYEMIPPLKTFTEFLNSLVELVKQVNKPLVWITPSNLTINLSSRKLKSVRTKTKLFKASNPITISIPTDDFDYHAFKKGFIANLIHSLDAANLHILIKLLKDFNYDNIPLYTIHDCFATTPNHLKVLNQVILSAFIKLYFDSNYIVKLYDTIVSQICSYGFELKDQDGFKYFINRNDSDGPSIIPLPSIPKELLKNWNDNKEIFLENLKKSSYFLC